MIDEAMMMEKSFSIDEILRGLYRAVLGREIDRTGLSDMREALIGGADIETVISGVIRSDEYRNNAVNQQLGFVRFTNDVSQHGEVWELLREWINEYSYNRVVVDIGARGRERSNSYDLMKHFGWRGLLVEANPSLSSQIMEQFAGLDYTLVSCGVSDYEGQASLTIGINDDVSSLDASTSASWGETRGTIDITVRRLAAILADFNVPREFDLLSLDIEGEDVKVLNDLIGSSPYRPRWVLIETGPIQSFNALPFSAAVTASYEFRNCIGPNTMLRLR